MFPGLKKQPSIGMNRSTDLKQITNLPYPLLISGFSCGWVGIPPLNPCHPLGLQTFLSSPWWVFMWLRRYLLMLKPIPHIWHLYSLKCKKKERKIEKRKSEKMILINDLNYIGEMTNVSYLYGILFHFSQIEKKSHIKI